MPFIIQKVNKQPIKTHYEVSSLLELWAPFIFFLIDVSSNPFPLSISSLDLKETLALWCWYDQISTLANCKSF